MQDEFHEILDLTSTAQSNSVQLKRGEESLFDMRVKIRSQEKCPICNSHFRLSPPGLTCPQHFKIRPTRYYLDWYFMGEQFKLFGFDSFKAAYQKAAVIEDELNGRRFRPQNYKGQKTEVNKKFKFEERFDGWIKLKEKQLKPSAYLKITQYKKEYDVFFKGEDIRTIGTDRITSYYESLLGKVSNKTICNKLGVLHSFLKNMYDREAIHQMPRFPKISYVRKEPLWITRDEQLKVLNAIPVQYRQIFIFLFESGCRHGEARALHWQDIDFDKEVITIRNNFSGKVLTTPKDGEERKIPLTTALRAVLLSQPRTLRSDFVFTLAGKPYYESSIGKIWRSACKLVGVKGVTPYAGTRHSFASRLVNKGKSLEIIGEILGHSDIRTTRKYAHVHLDAMRQAMED
jgi:integrase